MSNTPETDALRDLYENHEHRATVGDIWELCESLERQRDEARILCRWAFPRLRAMCHDADNEGTGWCCDEEMKNHPEIFDEKTPP